MPVDAGRRPQAYALNGAAIAGRLPGAEACPAGAHAEAQEHLTTAATMYREMDMRFWLEKADAELGGVER